MKKIIAFILLLTSASLSAGYSPRGINEYFSDGKVYYRGISENKEERGFISSKMSSSPCINLQVFDLDSGKTWRIFEKNLRKNLSITEVVFERPAEILQRTHFTDARFQNTKVSSKAKDRLIIVVHDSESGISTLWSANRLGKELKEITQVSEDEDWHVDSANERIRIFSILSDSYKMREYPW